MSRASVGEVGAAPSRARAPGPGEVRLRVGSRIAWLDVITSLAEDLARRAGLDADGCFDVMMAIREAASNAMVHGNRREEARLVDIRFRVIDDRLEMRVLDEGPGFDPSELPDPTTERNRMRSSGRGVFLIKYHMDEVDLAAVSLSGGEIRMVKKIPRGTGPVPPGPAKAGLRT